MAKFDKVTQIVKMATQGKRRKWPKHDRIVPNGKNSKT